MTYAARLCNMAAKNWGYSPKYTIWEVPFSLLMWMIVIEKQDSGQLRILNHTDAEIEEAFRQMEKHMDNGKET